MERGQRVDFGDHRDNPAVDGTYDVIVLGGGLAGLSAAIQLRKCESAPEVLVVERAKFPVREAAHKVGESTVEIGARYFSEVIGMKHYLETRHLRKMGLRFFFPAAGNDRIEDRLEVGPSSLPAIPAYQIDRGRFENELVREAEDCGAKVMSETSVRRVEFGADDHRVTVSKNGEERSFRCRWVVDASGRAGVLKRQLKLVRNNHHDVNASWWRIGESVAIDDWSTDAGWQARIRSHCRRLSTNHLMGEGYWVWIIPLASNSTSFGIVADQHLHPFDSINTFERSLDWLCKHEPQCGAWVSRFRDRIQDFRVMKHFSHECSRVFSAQRWALTGEAGVFLDPFYSPGSDFIALGNTYITDVIDRDLRGEDIRQRIEAFNSQYFSLFHNSLLFYENQYQIMGNARVMTVKLVWDHTMYWAALALLYFHDKICDLEFMRLARIRLLRFARLNLQIQMCFRNWHELGQCASEKGFVNLQDLTFLYRSVYSALTARLDDASLLQQLDENLELLESFAGWIFKVAAEGLRPLPIPSSFPKRSRRVPIARLQTEGIKDSVSVHI